MTTTMHLLWEQIRSRPSVHILCVCLVCIDSFSLELSDSTIYHPPLYMWLSQKDHKTHTFYKNNKKFY